MDEIQRVLIKEDRKDLAQLYYEKVSGKIPGKPDGTGPMKDSPSCPFNKDDEELSEKKAFFNSNDFLLDGFSYQDLIDVVISNEKVRDESAVKKVFKEILNFNVRDANSVLRSEMKNIIKAIEKETKNY